MYPNPSDGGLAVGAAMAGFLIHNGKIDRKELLHSAFGREYSSKEIASALSKNKKLVYKKLKGNIAKNTASFY